MDLVLGWMRSLDEATVHEYLKVFVCGLPLILIVGKLFFGSWGGFFESIRYLLLPDIVSLVRGEWGEDQWASFKLVLFLGLCTFAVYSAHRYFFPV